MEDPDDVALGSGHPAAAGQAVDARGHAPGRHGPGQPRNGGARDAVTSRRAAEDRAGPVGSRVRREGRPVPGRDMARPPAVPQARPGLPALRGMDRPDGRSRGWALGAPGPRPLPGQYRHGRALAHELPADQPARAQARVRDRRPVRAPRRAEHVPRPRPGGMPSMVNRKPFPVGERLACTPGAVVYREEIFELL